MVSLLFRQNIISLLYRSVLLKQSLFAESNREDSWIVWCRYDEKACSQRVLEAIFLDWIAGYCTGSSRDMSLDCMAEEILSMMSNVYSLGVLDAWKLISRRRYWALLASLRRANGLIGWNWGSGAELRLLAKISVLNELNSAGLAAKQAFDWPADRASRRYSYLYVIQAFFRFSLCSFSKVWFSCCIGALCWSRVYFLRALRWSLRLYEGRCYWYDEEGVFSKGSRVKDWEFGYWWSWFIGGLGAWWLSIGAGLI